jgi:hypothetical protein
VAVRATGTGSIQTRLIGWKNKPGMTDVPTKRIIGLAIAMVSKAGISINLDNLVLDVRAAMPSIGNGNAALREVYYHRDRRL